jgi:hypothetical protein
MIFPITRQRRYTPHGQPTGSCAGLPVGVPGTTVAVLGAYRLIYRFVRRSRESLSEVFVLTRIAPHGGLLRIAEVFFVLARIAPYTHG